MKQLNGLRNKRGSSYIEATLIMPLTCLIVVSLIGLMLNLFNDLEKNICAHKEESIEIYRSGEVTFIRVNDKMLNEITGDES